MPRRKRQKSALPSWAWMSFRPLWPACEPPCFNFTWPGLKSSSSWATRISPGSILKNRASAATDLPDRFMNVAGSSSQMTWPPTLARTAWPK